MWNAARIEALWDSIFHDIPLGALSVRRQSNDTNALDLLDGQQRATAVALGYEKFPNLNSEYRHRYDSILWIDLDKELENHDAFFVTTASQPWGYANTASETKNTLLPMGERRVASKDIKLEEKQIKPYPYQLYPIRAIAPVPYTLLREFIESDSGGGCKAPLFSSFINDLKGRINGELWNKLNDFKAEFDEKRFVALCLKIKKCSAEYPVFLLDASSVSDQDIALYFTRIGRGGGRANG